MISEKEMRDYLREEHTVFIKPRYGGLAYCLQIALDSGCFEDFKVDEVRMTGKGTIVFEGKGKPSIIPEYGLKENYAVQVAADSGYFDDFEEGRLVELAEQLELTTTQTKELVENCATKVLQDVSEFMSKQFPEPAH